MDSEKDIHNYNADVKRYTERIETDSELNEQNRKDLLRYAKAMQDLSPGTQSKNLQVMLRISKQVDKPFKKASRKEIDKALDSVIGSELTKWTKAKYRSCLKKFYKWLYGSEDYPEQVRHIKSKKPKTRGVPLDRLTLEDYKALIQAAQSPRDKFLISILADTGARVGEIGSMNIENIEDKENHLMAQISESKTQTRSLPVRNCRPYLLDYLQVHPRNKAGEPLLLDRAGKRLTYAAIRRVLQDAAKKAGITKNVSPHHFRRSTATIYGSYFTESQLDSWFGWGNAKISNVYVSFSGKQLLEAYNKFWESEKNIIRQITCPACQEQNGGALQYCKKCQAPLLEKTVLEAKQEEKDFFAETLNRAFMNQAKRKRLIQFMANLAQETGTAKELVKG